MENKLNNVSKIEINEITANSGIFKFSCDYQQNKETYNNGDILELNKLSTDEVELLSERKVKNGIEGIEGELLINHTNDASFELDINGNLKVVDYNVDKYYINDMGELILNL